MKSITGTLLTAAAVMFSSVAFAKDDVTCPSTDIILSHATFIKAYEFGEGEWIMQTNHFKVADHKWDIFFRVNLPNAQSKADALNLGQRYFQENVVLNEPEKDNDNRHTACIYNDTEDYSVVAINPPVNLPNFDASFVSRLHLKAK